MVDLIRRCKAILTIKSSIVDLIKIHVHNTSYPVEANHLTHLRELHLYKHASVSCLRTQKGGERGVRVGIRQRINDD